MFEENEKWLSFFKMINFTAVNPEEEFAPAANARPCMQNSYNRPALSDHGLKMGRLPGHDFKRG